MSRRIRGSNWSFYWCVGWGGIGGRSEIPELVDRSFGCGEGERIRKRSRRMRVSLQATSCSLYSIDTLPCLR